MLEILESMFIKDIKCLPLQITWRNEPTLARCLWLLNSFKVLTLMSFMKLLREGKFNGEKKQDS